MGGYVVDKKSNKAIYAVCVNYDAGNALITEALESNTENAEFWYYYAVFSKGWNLADDAGYGALKAIELTYLSQRKKEIEREFSQEIRTLSSE